MKSLFFYNCFPLKICLLQELFKFAKKITINEMLLTEIPTKEDILFAYELIKSKIHKTPVLTSKYFDTLCNSNLFFKCENFQKTGSFKARGATNAVFSNLNIIGDCGVATHSSGNHAAALAWAAQQAGKRTYLVMPENSSKAKIEAVRSYNGEITFCKPTLEEREKTLFEIVEKTKAVFIHPFDNYDVICGQATAAFELISEVPDLDIIITPVGGGGLLSGTLLSTKYFGKNIRTYAAEPANAADAKLSLETKRIEKPFTTFTVCDGLRTSLSEKTFEIISKNVEDILVVEDSEVLSAMHAIWQRMKIVVEPSSATVLAAVIKNKEIFENKKVGLILTGGNIEIGRGLGN